MDLRRLDLAARRRIRRTPMLSPFEIFADCTQAHLDANRDWLMPRFQDPQSGILAITIQSFLVRQNGLTILVDACGGNDKERARPHFHRRAWPWLDRLARRRRQRPRTSTSCSARICMSITSAGTRAWRTAAGCRPFPTRAIWSAQREWDYWRTAGPAALVRTGDFITDSVLPIFDSGQAELIGDEHALASDISIEAAPGHTPGPVDAAARRRRQRSDPLLRPDAPPVAASLSGMEHAVLRRPGPGARELA